MRKLAPLLYLLTVCSFAEAAVSLNTASTACEINNINGASTTCSTVVAAGSDRVLYALIFFYPHDSQNYTVSAVARDGQSFTKLKELDLGSGNAKYQIWQLIDPNVGTADITATYSGTYWMDVSIYPVSFNGVHQTTPSDVTADASPTGTTSGSISLTTLVDNSWMISLAYAGSGTTTTLGAGQTTLGRTQATFAQASYSGPLTPTGSKTHTYNTVPSVNWQLVAASVQPTEIVPEIYSGRRVYDIS